MIAEIKFKNILSFRDEAVFSFEADKSRDMESYHVVEVMPDVRLLKFGVLYGANASGKSNLIKIYDFFRSFIRHTPLSKAEPTGIIPFMMDGVSRSQDSEISVLFYIIKDGEAPYKCQYTLALNGDFVSRESLAYYPSVQPATIFERKYENGVSTIKFGTKLKLSNAAKEEITLKCLPNMSVLAAYMQVNVSTPEVEDVLAYFNKRDDFTISPSNPQIITKYEALKDVKRKDYILKYLKEADFNITDIYAQDPNDTSFGEIVCKHTVTNKEGEKETFELDEKFESDGTQITMEMASRINILIENDGLLLIDEIESSLHPKLVEYIIERFLQESKYAQLLVTTHYDGLLAQDDLLRKDNIWFTEKGDDGASTLYPLTDFKALNRISSLQKAYKFGKFGAIPNI